MAAGYEEKLAAAGPRNSEFTFGSGATLSAAIKNQDAHTVKWFAKRPKPAVRFVTGWKRVQRRAMYRGGDTDDPSLGKAMLYR